MHGSLDVAIARNPVRIVVVVDVGASASGRVVMVVLDALVLGSAVLFSVATRVHAGCVGLHQVLSLNIGRGVLSRVRYLDFVVVVGKSLTYPNGVSLILLLVHTVVVTLN